MALFIGIFLSSTSRVIVSLLKFDTVSHRGSTNSQTGRISRITIALSSCIGGSLKSLFAPLSVEVKTSVVHGFSMVFFSSPLLIRLLRKLCHVSGRVANACAIRRGRNLCWYALSLLLHCSKSLSLLQAGETSMSSFGSDCFPHRSRPQMVRSAFCGPFLASQPLSPSRCSRRIRSHLTPKFSRCCF